MFYKIIYNIDRESLKQIENKTLLENYAYKIMNLIYPSFNFPFYKEIFERKITKKKVH